AYDANSNLTQVTDPRSNNTRYKYDALNHQTAVVDAFSATTTFTYDVAGNSTLITDPLGHTTQYQYDNLNRKTLMTQADPDGSTSTLTAPSTVYSYDAVGNLTQVTDPLSNNTRYK